MDIPHETSALAPGRTRVTLAPHGELDAGTVGELAQAVTAALSDGAYELDVDLSAVTFMDTTALRVLDSAREVLALRGGHLCLRNPAPPVRRLLGLTALFPSPLAA